MSNETVDERFRRVVLDRFGIQEEDIVWYRAGAVYNSIVVKTQEAADKVTAAVAGQTVKGGYMHGQELGQQTADQDGIFVMC
jgi:hypothetical protein